MSNWNEGLGKTVIDLRLEDAWVTQAMDYAKQVITSENPATLEEEIIIGMAASLAGMAMRVVEDFEDAGAHEHVLVSLMGLHDLPRSAQLAAIQRINDMGVEISQMAEGIIAARGN